MRAASKAFGLRNLWAAALLGLSMFGHVAWAQVELSPPVFDPYTPTDPFNPPPIQPPHGFYEPYCDTGGVEGGIQLAILEPQVGTISTPLVPFLGDVTPDFDFELSPRIWAGYQFPGGLGVRGRWWHFEADGSGDPILTGVTLPFLIQGFNTLAIQSFQLASSIELDVLDLELSQEGRFHNWEFEVAGGVRYAELEFTNTAAFNVVLSNSAGPPPPPLATVVEFAAQSKFEGFGPTVNFFARRPLGFWEGLSFVADARFSFLFGDTDVGIGANFLGNNLIPVATVSNHAMQIWELRVGADWTKTLQSGAQLHLGAFLEGQVWEWSIPVIAPGSDLGFVGPTAFIEITR
jgi:hypothetical protein